ncbi:MAG: hypothetical protein PHE86_02640 [Candidatus Marinimicrobia bacterium]|nr:hypothetical protein [Candidatus Neomarinimicrobiota bacterium]
MRYLNRTLLFFLLINALTAEEITRSELTIRDHQFYFYYNISHIGVGYQTTPQHSDLLQVEARGYPKTLVGPAAYKITPDVYDLCVINTLNLWDIYANSKRPYQIQLFYGTVNKQKNKPYHIRGASISFSHLLSVGHAFVPYASFEVGVENKNIDYFSDLAQDVYTKRLSLLFIGEDLNDQIIKFNFYRKGVNAEKLPLIRFPNILLKFSANWSLNTSYNRRLELLLGKAYFIKTTRTNFYFTPYVGAQLLLPITINLNNDFLIDSHPICLIPVIRAEFYFPNKILLED